VAGPQPRGLLRHTDGMYTDASGLAEADAVVVAVGEAVPDVDAVVVAVGEGVPDIEAPGVGDVEGAASTEEAAETLAVELAVMLADGEDAAPVEAAEEAVALGEMPAGAPAGLAEVCVLLPPPLPPPAAGDGDAEAATEDVGDGDALGLGAMTGSFTATATGGVARLTAAGSMGSRSDACAHSLAKAANASTSAGGDAKWAARLSATEVPSELAAAAEARVTYTVQLMYTDAPPTASRRRPLTLRLLGAAAPTG
jgi:hypothetical protein